MRPRSLPIHLHPGRIELILQSEEAIVAVVLQQRDLRRHVYEPVVPPRLNLAIRRLAEMHVRAERRQQIDLPLGVALDQEVGVVEHDA